MIYETLLLFGPVLVAAFIFGVLFQQRHALYLRHALQVILVALIGFYFVLSWVRGGQTLPMKTWGIRLVTTDGSPIKLGRAIVRFGLAWLWILPGLLLASAFHAQTTMLVIAPAVNVLAWALAVYLDPQRQFLHDRLAGTRLIGVATPWSKHTEASSTRA